ncbi:MAG: glutamate--cysteine ligase [Micrococcales bacterium]|nr:MAG: glutamate--cysteine ligase [Micrococcales bacterium]PIE26674.1 MAG: glutamate--cysteine ligase [Micrococcales bacterium]
MGEEVSSAVYSREQRQQYREKVQLCLDVLGRMLASADMFSPGRLTTGMEIELNLVDGDYQPAMKNAAVLERIADEAYQTEIGAFNIEFNVPPKPLPGRAILDLEAMLRDSLNAAQVKANAAGANIVMVGILPTLMQEHLTGDWMSPSTRYQALNDAMVDARGEDIIIDIAGAERLRMAAKSIAPEAACTSLQLHVEVSPDMFAQYWNAAQVLLGPQLAVGANSPYFFGKQLWAETRTEVFTQSTDVRPEELRNQGVRPRVFFGDHWITSIWDLFEENVRYFPALLPELSEEDPEAVFEAGEPPQLTELRLHNGTVYRWNRPIYDVHGGTPHLRVENRVLPAGPTVVDTLANAAFYYGALRSIAEDHRPAWTRMSFAAAHDNFLSCAKDGLDGTIYWPGTGPCPADELVLRKLLPMAEEGLRAWGMDAEARDRYLGIVEERVTSGRNGASWQVQAVHRFEQRGMDRRAALTAMLRAYSEGMHSNQPVHTWDIP